jgi:uridine phosphorylase
MPANDSFSAFSELILTPAGGAYHLHLHPEQLADTIITVGDPERVALITQHFDSIECRVSNREFVSHTGRLGSKRITVVSTGIGPDNIDIVLNELDALANIHFETRTLKEAFRRLTIIRLGTCGSLQESAPVDSLVASSFGIGLDNLLSFYNYERNPEEQFILTEFLQHTGLESSGIQPYIAEGSIRLRNHFGGHFPAGITVTCPGFYGPQGRSLRLSARLGHLPRLLSNFECRGEKVLNLEMETAALYGLGHLLGHHCLSISVVVADRQRGLFSADGGAAIENLIQKALPLLESL